MKFVSKPSPKHESIFDDFKCGKETDTGTGELGNGDLFLKSVTYSEMGVKSSEEPGGNVFITV